MVQVYTICLSPFLVGGIYTVIRSKAGVTSEELGENYFLIGVYNERQAETEIEELEPEFKIVKDVLDDFKAEGVKVSMS